MTEYNALTVPKQHHRMREAFSLATDKLASSIATPGATRTISVSEGLRALTPKQRKVLSLLSFGFSNKEIAAMMSVAESTIKAHVGAIFHAFGCTNRVQAALIAFSMRQHMPAAELLRSRRLPSEAEVERLSSFFDR
jgi:DNA-binding NarL/FixJ family response regulator